ncbi:ABC transporter permease [Nesterenkonia muleiensis]|uniref:ABC transporter permease n=1 Tax=Nesterenkonia muleiensis TaxID=2282648 RepID=UPI000E708AA6|nr:ABC transporter permease [Nesterenkonia muleiensis]
MRDPVVTTPRLGTARIAASSIRFSSALKWALRNPLAIVGAMVILIAVIASIFASWIQTHEPSARDAMSALNAPSAEFYFGTDSFGRDIFSRVINGGRITLSAAALAVFGSAIFGVTLGLVSGYFPGYTRNIINRFIDILFSFPDLILAMSIAAAIGPGFWTTVIAIAFGAIAPFARVTYSTVLSMKESEFIYAARISGISSLRIMFTHVLPNCISPILVQLTLALGFAILNVSALSFIGLGAQPPDAEWGLMVSEGRHYILSGQWWITFFPGFTIAILVLSFNLLGDTLRDVFDPRYKL